MSRSAGGQELQPWEVKSSTKTGEREAGFGGLEGRGGGSERPLAEATWLGREGEGEEEPWKQEKKRGMAMASSKLRVRMAMAMPGRMQRRSEESA